MSDKSAIEQKYIDLLGFVPDGIQNRLDLANKTNRMASIEAIEKFREELIYKTAIEPKVQQLIHFAMLIAKGEDSPARLHAIGALKAGASVDELFAVCETGAIIGGMPTFQRAVNVVAEAVKAKD